VEAAVATIAETYSVRRASAKAPFSTHPAFPVVVALWFAALLGLGSLALPAALLEGLVALTGLAALIPSAAPPLGFTAHAGIAIAAAIVGAPIGLLLARKVAEAHAAEPQLPQVAFDEARKCRPILAHDELGEEGLAPAPDASLVANKRRSLAATNDGPGGINMPIVPLPGLSADEPPGFDRQDQAAEVDADSAEATFHQSVETTDGIDIGNAEVSVPPMASRPLTELGLLQLTERLGASLANRAARVAAAGAGSATRAEPPFVRTAHLDAAEAEDAARAIADFFAPGIDPPAEALDEEHFAQEVEDVDYSSLLAMKNPFTR
jgi:hypothetical protein